MKKIVVLIALALTVNAFACCRSYCTSSSGVRLAGDIIRLVDRGLTVLDRHAYCAPPVPVTCVPAGMAAPAPVAAQPAPVAVETAVPTVVNVQYVYPNRRPLHYQTPGNIPPQRGLVYAR